MLIMLGGCIVGVDFSDAELGSAILKSNTSSVIRPSSATVSWQEMYKVAYQVMERCLEDGGHAVSGPSPALGS